MLTSKEFLTMYFIGNECVACLRTHPGAHDRGCLNAGYSHVSIGAAPAPSAERWWLALPADPTGRILDRWHVAEAMAAMRWHRFNYVLLDFQITTLSSALMGSGWCLAAYTNEVTPRALHPYSLIGIEHARRDGARRIFWLACHNETANVIAVDLVDGPVPVSAMQDGDDHADAA